MLTVMVKDRIYGIRGRITLLELQFSDYTIKQVNNNSLLKISDSRLNCNSLDEAGLFRNQIFFSF